MFLICNSESIFRRNSWCFGDCWNIIDTPVYLVDKTIFIDMRDNLTSNDFEIAIKLLDSGMTFFGKFGCGVFFETQIGYLRWSKVII